MRPGEKQIQLCSSSGGKILLVANSTINKVKFLLL